ncbi:ABC transporter substrate-binding protein [Thiomicrorhabdus sp. 6S2-11]|uniref:ABC transporter substrate-binding protein n=1 Tax=Thiomicrorhabdus marina TaxID=2818442 RepID=A0ABS3Q3Z7_9GAMM|nr:ABC transporter substrate-binding protein [Thiomicrorhabdus marina]MBO1927058.1 ABC transporter substrate-binding protein [Thiomicrorhabdus marina]
MKLCISCEIKNARYLLSGLAFIVLILGFSHKAHAERIITIDGSLTEIAYALDSKDLIVGRDVTSIYPAEAAKLPNVGYMRQLSAEGILSLNPSLVITTTDAKPQKVFTQLKEAGVKVVQIKNNFTVGGVYHKIREMGKVLDKDVEAEAMIRKIQVQLAETQSKIKSLTGNKVKHAIFTMGMRNGNMMVAGKNTRADEMLRLAGVHNAPADLITGYKPLTAESAILYNPSFLITMQQGLQSSGGRESMLNSTAISMTEAGKQKNLIVMNNSFLNFGPRIGEEILKLANHIYDRNNQLSFRDLQDTP